MHFHLIARLVAVVNLVGEGVQELDGPSVKVGALLEDLMGVSGGVCHGSVRSGGDHVMIDRDVMIDCDVMIDDSPFVLY